MKKFASVLPVAAVLLLTSNVAFAEGDAAPMDVGNLAAGFAMGLAVLGGALGQGQATKAMYESVSRNPQAAGKLNTPFFVGLAFIESLCLFALVIAYVLATEVTP
ncbi:MAG: ATP synthase F0 subunit C [Myxococcota bacterium]